MSDNEISSDEPTDNICNVYVQLDSEECTLPKKAYESDAGFDVSIIKRKNTENEDDIFKVIMFHTGIHIQPPEGYYFEMVPRSSLQKLGYTLANCVGIIDNSYRGEIFVPLYKFDKTKPDITLPQRVVQLIPRKIVNCKMIQKTYLENTERGENGFGSTGKC